VAEGTTCGLTLAVKTNEPPFGERDVVAVSRLPASTRSATGRGNAGFRLQIIKRRALSPLAAGKIACEVVAPLMGR
jgi:hypothetical protein